MQFKSVRLTTLLLVLIFSGSATGKQTPNDNLDFRGALFPQSTKQGEELLRFAPKLLEDISKPKIVRSS
jgi:hypothetical protein